MTRYALDIEAVNQFVLDSKGKYINGRRSCTYVLPLPTRTPERAKFDKGFWSVTGGIARLVHREPEDNTNDKMNVDAIIEQGKFQSEETKELFTYYLKEQMKEVERQQVTQLSQLRNIKLVDLKSERKGEVEYIRYVYDVFIGDSADLVVDYLTNKDEFNLLNEVIYSLHEDSKNEKRQSQYPILFKEMQQQFLADFEYLSKNSLFLLENINAFLVHYVFLVMTQTILQTNKLTLFNEEAYTPLYFIMDWEKGAKWRENYTQGYKLLREQVKEFFVHEHVLNIVGQTTFTNKKNLYYHDIHRLLKEAGIEKEQEYIQSIYTWMKDVFSEKTGEEVADYNESKTLQQAFQDIVAAVTKNLSSELKSRYPKAYEEFVSRFYRKHGGSLGTLLSLSQEQLLMLVAISVKEERIELNTLWKEFEKRGVWLDYNSKEEVVKILDKLNYLEKKSDSGDAQYVKPIL